MRLLGILGLFINDGNALNRAGAADECASQSLRHGPDRRWRLFAKGTMRGTCWYTSDAKSLLDFLDLNSGSAQLKHRVNQRAIAQLDSELFVQVAELIVVQLRKNVVELF